MNRTANVVRIGLSAAIVSVAEEVPRVLAVGHPDDRRRTALRSLRSRSSTGRSKSASGVGCASRPISISTMPSSFIPSAIAAAIMVKSGEGPRVVSVGYLALVRAIGELRAPDAHWQDWYGYFPWEDWRQTRPVIIDTVILPALAAFAKRADDPAQAKLRRQRAALCFARRGRRLGRGARARALRTALRSGSGRGSPARRPWQGRNCRRCRWARA